MLSLLSHLLHIGGVEVRAASHGAGFHSLVSDSFGDNVFLVDFCSHCALLNGIWLLDLLSRSSINVKVL